MKTRQVPGGLPRCIAIASLGCVAGGYATTALAQGKPIAIVPVEGVELTGALNLSGGKATLGAGGSVTAVDHAVTITLPHRGDLRLCATTKLDLTSDSTLDTAKVTPASTDPASPTGQDENGGLMMALGRGAIESHYMTGRNSDVILTPDFRILISGPGTSQVQVRLGPKGDTCVDNQGNNAPYVTVSSVFDGGAYRVQPNQRVMFQHGSLHEVVDNEKESCGCPEQAPSKTGNDFPVAESAGLSPLATPPSNVGPPGTVNAEATAQLGYSGANPVANAAEEEAPVVVKAPKGHRHKSKPGFFSSIAHFFQR
ncbi:MAG TPA: hypothetical protein VHZ52_06445, partial [Acidobacteriaceae bacterium]|nr:hypothetical protein [Acidobacteriaceae bacterium]